MIAALLLLTAVAAPDWVSVGVTASRLRVFIDRASIHEVQNRRQVRVRIGAPRVIVGRIVLVYELEEFDCSAHAWRMLEYEARDENDAIVRRLVLQGEQADLRPVVEDTIGGAVAQAVCRQ